MRLDDLAPLCFKMRQEGSLFSEGEDSNSADRKGWIERRVKELAEIFAVSVGGFSVMDNHLHLLLRLDTTKSEQWKAN